MEIITVERRMINPEKVYEVERDEFEETFLAIALAKDCGEL